MNKKSKSSRKRMEQRSGIKTSMKSNGVGRTQACKERHNAIIRRTGAR